MKNNFYCRRTVIFILVAALVTTGCSLVFWGIGAGIDNRSKYDRQRVEGWEIFKIPEGTEMELVTKAGKKYKGIFAGGARMNSRQDSADNVVLIRSSPNEYGVIHKIPANNVEFVRVKVRRQRTVVPLARLGSIEYDERVVVYRHKKGSVRGYFKGMQPVKGDSTGKSVSIVTGARPHALFSSRKNIPVSAIDSVIIPEKRTNVALSYIFIGMALDGLSVAAAAIAFSNTNFIDFNFSSGGSCPYVYSFDGKSYHRDAEIFGGAVFPAAQRSDWDNLDFLVPDDKGICRLDLTNELDETQYVDALQLLAVDHPKGTNVYPSFEGKLFTVSTPQAPVAAVTSGGADVRESLREKDGDYWFSSPFNRNPRNPADLRDGAVLEFSRPAGSNSAVLVFNVINTIWAAEMQRKLLALPGADLPAWYQKLEASAAERQILHDAMVREGMLLVSVWDGKTWRRAGHVWEVGTAVAKDVALEIDLSDVAVEALRVRLDCPPGVWMVDRVSADFSYSTNTSAAQTVRPLRATDEQGHDITIMLDQTDHQYFIMPDTKARATVEYRVPAGPAKGFGRTYLVQSSGYYTIHSKTDAQPQQALFRQLLETPGAYDRYVLERLNAAAKEIMQE